MMKLLTWLSILLHLSVTLGQHYEHSATETEMFATPVSPNMFNWTYQEFDQQYRFHASLVGKPELPSWLRYIYSGRHHSGFVFGTPPRGIKSPVTLEVIGLNRQDFETRHIQITLNIIRIEPAALATSQLQLKIDNLNVEDLLDKHRMDRLKEIFTTKLWPGSEGKIHATFLAAAVDLGARLPLRPNEGEGLVVRLGSAQPFSAELRNLRDEVQPLSRLAACPRDFKRTTVERLFRLAAFTLDWCSFKLYDVRYTEVGTVLTEILDDQSSKPTAEDKHESYELPPDLPSWRAPRLRDIPARSYAREILLSVAIPLLLLLAPVTTLAVLCRRAAPGRVASRVELCRYPEGASCDKEEPLPLTTSDSESAGVSPNATLARPYSPKSTTNMAGSFNRPQPPPYLGSNTNTLAPRDTSPSTRAPTPDKTASTVDYVRPSSAIDNLVLQRPRTLEESLQLLNDANISNDYMEDIRERIRPILKHPVVDAEDGTEDYVHVNEFKPDGNTEPIESYDAKEGYVPMKPDMGYVVMTPNVTTQVEGEPPIKTWFC